MTAPTRRRRRRTLLGDLNMMRDAMKLPICINNVLHIYRDWITILWFIKCKVILFLDWLLATEILQPSIILHTKTVLDIISSLGNYSCSQFNAFVSFRKRFVIKLMESNGVLSAYKKRVALFVKLPMDSVTVQYISHFYFSFPSHCCNQSAGVMSY